MNKKADARMQNELTSAVMTLLVSVSAYILSYTSEMKNNADMFLSGYNSVPYMIECVLGGLMCCLAFMFAAEKYRTSDK